MYAHAGPLLDRPAMRRAVNYAIDRRALARAGGLNYGGPAVPTDQYLPPGMPGFDDEPIYPATPDLARARRLARGGPRSVVLYAFDSGTSPELAQIVKVNLKAFGIAVMFGRSPSASCSSESSGPASRTTWR